MANFPLVVIGIAVNPGEPSEPVKGYTVDEEDAEDSGDLGQASAPPATEAVRAPEKPMDSFDGQLRSLIPSTSPFPLVRRLVLVPGQIPRNSTPRPSSATNGTSGPDEEASKLGKGEAREGEVVYAPREGIEGWVRGMMGEVVGEVLGELGELVSAVYTGR